MSEFEELKEHLRDCSDCGNLCEDFRRLASEDLGVVAILKEKQLSTDGLHEVAERELLSRVLDRASRGRISVTPVAATELAGPKRRTLRDRVSGAAFEAAQTGSLLWSARIEFVPFRRDRRVPFETGSTDPNFASFEF